MHKRVLPCFGCLLGPEHVSSYDTDFVNERAGQQQHLLSQGRMQGWSVAWGLGRARFGLYVTAKLHTECTKQAAAKQFRQSQMCAGS